MATRSKLEILPPNNPKGFHQRRGERVEQKCVEIGKGPCQDFIIDSTLIGCDLRILCGAFSVNLFRSSFERCTFRPRREFKNMRFTGMTFRGCTFLGKYNGCRFGNWDAEDAGAVSDCDFSQAGLFHLCDFGGGMDVGSLRWPPWPHIVVTDLKRTARAWLELTLPEELRIVQAVIGDDPRDSAVTLYLPAETQRAEELRPLFASQSFIVIAEPGAAADDEGG